MKKLLLVFSIVPVGIIAQQVSESQFINTNESGVKVYEGARAVPSSNSHTKPVIDTIREARDPFDDIQFYDEQQCQEALSQINQKIEQLETHSKSEDDITPFLKYREQIIARLKELNSGN